MVRIITDAEAAALVDGQIDPDALSEPNRRIIKSVLMPGDAVDLLCGVSQRQLEKLLNAAREESRAALEPLAAFALFEEAVSSITGEPKQPDGSTFKHWDRAFGMEGPRLTYGDLRRAAAVLAGQ